MRKETLRSPEPPAVEHGRRVLLADDDNLVIESARRVLTAAGFDVTALPDGTTAVEAVIAERFDVIVTDIRMPGTSGIDLLRTVRAYDADVPVILMTGMPDLESAIEAVDLGAHAYLRKPFTAEVLVGAVERASNSHRAARERREALTRSRSAPPSEADRAQLHQTLDSALESLWIAYQPIVSVGGRRVVGYEALLRSRETALPDPHAVLGAAERLGRLSDLGRRIRTLAAATFTGVPDDALLFLNLHPHDLLDPALASDTAPLSEIAGRVVLELTERCSIDAVPEIEARVSILRYMGYRLAIDDLGAGYSGLSSFARLEPEFVKLDMTLVRDVHVSAVRQRVVAAVTSLCDDMGMTVIAEGVEVAAERDHVRELGCDLQQGFLFGRPAPELAPASF